jgi:membrane complex biogenesis BtpA family protein
MNLLLTKERPALIGVVHLKPLPGAPGWQGDLARVIELAVNDARAYHRGGATAVIIENYGDAPFGKGAVAPETIASMAAAGCAVKAAVPLPIGFNVLRNDPHGALALSAACGGAFIRVNVHCGVMVTDQGIIEGDAYHTLRRRQQWAPGTRIWADVHVKHASPLITQSIGQVASETLERGGADALIISGFGTGHPVDLGDLEAVRAACPHAPLLLGSGVTAENVREYLPFANGFIVGSSLKRAGNIQQPVDVRRVAALAKAIKGG